MSRRFGITSERVFLHNSHKPALVIVEGETVADVVDRRAPFDGPVVDVGGLVLMPALVDTNVHTGDPGRTHWEGFATATAAAAAGGVAVIVDMPHASIPPVLTTPAVARKRSATAGALHVDVALWGGLVAGNLPEIRPMADAGVIGFASLMRHGAQPRIPALSPADLEAALRSVHALSQPLLIRAEMDRGQPSDDTYAAFLEAHPPEAEVEAVATVIDAVRRTRAWAHLVGLSSADALPMLAAARRDDLLVTVETCAHHLVFSAEEIDDTLLATVPPIRDHGNREALWQGLADGVIDMVVSDHAPVAPNERTTSFATTRPGIGSLELRLPVLWTEASRRGFRLSHLVQWASRAPAALARIRTGRIEPGQRADLIAWDPDEELVVRTELLHQRHKQTPYAGRRLRGVVHRTWSAGRLVYADGRIVGEPRGRILSYWQ